jgi:hypothetical protein
MRRGSAHKPPSRLGEIPPGRNLAAAMSIPAWRSVIQSGNGCFSTRAPIAAQCRSEVFSANPNIERLASVLLLTG